MEFIYGLICVLIIVFSFVLARHTMKFFYVPIGFVTNFDT